MARQKFSRGLKRSICIEYMQSGKSRQEIALKYNLPTVNTLTGWIQSCLSPLEIHEKCASLPKVNAQTEIDMANGKVSNVTDQMALLDAQQKEIARLEKALKRSEDKNLALNVLIDIAEERGIKVRKRSGAKQ